MDKEMTVLIVFDLDVECHYIWPSPCSFPFNFHRQRTISSPALRNIDQDDKHTNHLGLWPLLPRKLNTLHVQQGHRRQRDRGLLLSGN